MLREIRANDMWEEVIKAEDAGHDHDMSCTNEFYATFIECEELMIGVAEDSEFDRIIGEI